MRYTHERSDGFWSSSLREPRSWRSSSLFTQRSRSNPRYAFDTAAGRYIVLCFFGSAANPIAREAIDAVLANRGFFDDDRACFFGVTVDPRDETERRVQDSMPG